MNKNLRPAQKGNKLALKAPENRQTAIIHIRVTDKRKMELARRAEELGFKSMKDYLLDGK